MINRPYLKRALFQVTLALGAIVLFISFYALVTSQHDGPISTFRSLPAVGVVAGILIIVVANIANRASKSLP